MEKLIGTDISHFINLSNHKWIEDLIYYDGPFLSLYDNSDNWDYQYLYYWVDCDDEWNRYMIFEVDYDDLENYKNKNITLKDLILRAVNNVYVFMLSDGDVTDEIILVNKENIPISYFPNDDSFYDKKLNFKNSEERKE